MTWDEAETLALEEWSSLYSSVPIYVAGKHAPKIVQGWKGLDARNMKRLVDGSQRFFAQRNWSHIINEFSTDIDYQIYMRMLGVTMKKGWDQHQ